MAIIGRGNIAEILIDRDDVTFFASGVSNSGCTDPYEFNREAQLLLEQPKDKCLFYFSSISIFTKNKAYHVHKKNMEHVIKSNFQNYCIIRIGNIDWDTNPNTFLNFMREAIRNNERVVIRDEYKYMISKEQLLLLTNNLPSTGRNEINAFGYMAKVKNLL